MSGALLRLILGVAALVQWVIFARLSASSAEPPSGGGLQRAERNLVFSSVLAMVMWFFAFDGLSILGPRATIEKSALVSSVEGTRGTCASVEVGMPEAKVRELIGAPDSIQPAEDLRGPGAAIWRYHSSRCVIYLVDGKVEFID